MNMAYTADDLLFEARVAAVRSAAPSAVAVAAWEVINRAMLHIDAEQYSPGSEQPGSMDRFARAVEEEEAARSMTISFRRARKRDLIGRTITAVDFRPFGDGRGGRAYDPVFTLDNGQRVYFTVQETDVGEFGVRVDVPKKEEEGAHDARPEGEGSSR